ncbi:MAG: translocation/assembly module TamB domain-containing protein [Bacteroidales bacterium]|nr:translocation/assembly module TamB domain-containing protein [Bacteroidales bacterium]MBN2750790.1 translocation/assembly module TamB domain-containing protein [Bacteroidales bacterium]
MQNAFVQTWLVAKVSKTLSTTLNAEIQIGKVDYKLFSSIVLKDVLVKDQHKDTLLAAESIAASIIKFGIGENLLRFHTVVIDNAYINFATDSLGVMNLTALIDNIPQGDTTKKSDNPFSLDFRNVSILNSTFKLFNANAQPKSSGVNFQDMELTQLNLDVKNLSIAGDTITMTINDINFTEKSGLRVNRLRANFSISKHHMHFNKLRIVTNDSQVQMPDLHFSYNGYDKLSGFTEQVKLNANIAKSKISTKTLSYFASELAKYSVTANVSGKFKGTISDLRGRNVTVETGQLTKFVTNFSMTGLPNIEQTILFVDVKELSTYTSDLNFIRYTKSNKPLIVVPEQLKTLKKVTYIGSFTGYINNFVAYGTITSAIGQISMDISIKPDNSNQIDLNGNVSTQNLDIGLLTNSNLLGKTSLNATIKGKTDMKSSVNAFTDVLIKKLEANGYQYRNIKASGNINNRTYTGSVFLDDPNCKLNFMGTLNFTDSIPVYDFSAFVPKINLVALNLNKADSISEASFLLTAKFTGSNLDNSRGEIKVVNSFYRNQNGEFKISNITVNAENTEDSKRIAFKSEFAEGELRGKYNYANIYTSLEQLMFLYVPALSKTGLKPVIAGTGVENPEFNDYIIKFRLKKTQKLFNVLAPNLSIAENTSVFGIYNPDLQTLNLKVKIPEAKIDENIFKDITIDGQTHDSIFNASITSPEIDLGGTKIKNIAIISSAENNKVKVALSWDNKHSIKNFGEIIALTDFSKQPTDSARIAIVSFTPSELTLNDTTWNLAPSSVKIDTGKIVINQFSINNKNQHLNISGIISNSTTDTLKVNLKNIDVSNINFYLAKQGYSLDGNINGYANVTNIYKSPIFFADVEIDALAVNNLPFGDFHFESRWFNQEKKLSLNATNYRNDTLNLIAKGDIYTETQAIDVDVDIQNLPLKYVEPLLQGNASNLSGTLTSKLKVNGFTSKPNINGLAFLNNGKITVDFLNTTYTFTDKVAIANSNIALDNFTIKDVFNRNATVNGEITTKYFKDINLNLDIRPNNFQCMNTTEKDNDLFYGTVYASGLVSITGSPNNINMAISVKTENNTSFYLPLPEGGNVTESNFLTFASNNPDDIYIQENLSFDDEKKSNLALTFDLEVTPAAQAQIIIDKKLGDIIKANGSGNLKMEVNPNENKFKMFGDYVIEKGDYLFTLQGVINKKFSITQGSKISWSGEPTDANMDITAVYKVKTSLEQLALDQQNIEKYQRRVPVDCQILLNGKLMEPSIGFNIEVPTADSDTKAMVANALNTDDKMSRQFLSLLVINSFIADPSLVAASDPQAQSSGSNSGFSQGIYNTASELLSNQLSNWLSQWSDAVDIGVNYRPGDPASESKVNSDELELAVSTQLLNDRVTINGNVDMGARNSNSAIAGDFNVDVKITESGKLRLKAFARSNDNMVFSELAPYTTGAGIMFREEFNNFEDLVQRFKENFKPKRKKNDNYVEQDSTSTVYLVPPKIEAQPKQ